MELRCAIIVCSLVSLVIATPHGYGAKGGAVAKAEAVAVASAFSGLSGLPLSIPNGAGAVSGSFSKSSSSSFASSSASSSSGSFSYSGSGATGLSGFLGFPGNGECKSGGCQSGNGINTSQETSAGNNLPSYSGSYAAAAAGAIAGVQNGASRPCTGNNCSDQKSKCEGKDCKDFADINNNAPKKCSSSQCDTKTESGSTLNSNETTDICAKEYCGMNQSSGSTSIDFITNKECVPGSCASGIGSGAPSTDYGLNNFPGGMPGSSSLSSNNQPYNNDKTIVSAAHITPQQDNNTPNKIASESPLTPGSMEPNNNNGPFQNLNPKTQQTTCEGRHCDNEPGSKFPTTIQGSHDAKNCASGNCASQPSSHPTEINKPSPKIPSESSIIAPVPNPGCHSGNCGSFESSQNPDFGSSGSKPPSYSEGIPNKCISGNCGSHSSPPSYFGSSATKPKTPTYFPGFPEINSANCASGNCGAYPPGQNLGSGNSDSKISTHPESLPSTPGHCASGNCAGYPSPHPTNYDNSGSGPSIPNHNSIPSGGSPNCASGNCGSYPSGQYPSFDNSRPKSPANPTGVSNNPFNCASGNCATSPASGFTEPKSPTYFPGLSSSDTPNCAFGNCGSYPPSQHPGFETLGPKRPTTLAGDSNSPSNCASGNCASSLPSRPEFSAMGPKLPSYSPGTTSSSSPNCALGNCGSYSSNQHPNFDNSRPKSPTHAAVSSGGLPESSNSPSNCAFGNCGNLPSSTTGPKTPANFVGVPSDETTNCAFGNCNYNPSSQYPGFDPSGSKTPSISTSCTFGNCANVPSSGFSGTVTKLPNGSPPSNQYPSFDASGSKTPTYHEGASGGITNCAFGNCARGPQSGLTNVSPNCASGICDTQSSSLYPGFDISGGNPSNCATGNCANVHLSGSTGFTSTGHIVPNYSPKNPTSGPTNCASGNCGSYQPGQYPSIGTSAPPSYLLHGSAGSKFPAHSQESSPGPSGSTNCASGNCHIPSSQHTSVQSDSKIPSQTDDTFPAFVPLGPTKPTNVVGSPGVTHASGSINSAFSPTSNSGIVGGVHSSSSIFDTPKPSFNKDQIYTGGFGGPPGILNPYEFKSPPPGGYYSTTKNKPSSSSSCSSGSCASQPGLPGSNSGNIHPTVLGTDNPISCTSGKCDSHTNLPNYGQNGAFNAAFAAAASTANENGAVYTGGFGGPPGILKPYDSGKITNGVTNLFEKDSIVSQSGQDASNKGVYGLSSNKINGFGTQDGAAALNSAGTGGFGGPPGILKPYDGGKITSGATNFFGKDSIVSQSGQAASNNVHGLSNNKLNGFGTQAGAAALASAGAYSSGNHAGNNKGAGGCAGGCGASGSGSLDGTFAWSGGLEQPKTGLLNSLNGGLDAAGAVAKSIAGAISGTGANSFALGGSFAGSSAHAASGAASKGGYGR